MNLKDFEKELLKNPKFKKEYYDSDDITFVISEMVIDARIEKGLTQKQLADKIGTKQSSIARLEAASYLPSLSFLKKIARALDANLLPPKFEFSKSKKAIHKNNKTSKRLYLKYAKI